MMDWVTSPFGHDAVPPLSVVRVWDQETEEPVGVLGNGEGSPRQ